MISRVGKHRRENQPDPLVGRPYQPCDDGLYPLGDRHRDRWGPDDFLDRGGPDAWNRGPVKQA